jgi:hypothetical protein
VAITSGSKTMPDKNVTLDIRYVRAEPGDGFIDVGIVNGRSYCYKYTGGDDGAGGVTHTIGDGNAKITVTLIADPRYRIASVSFVDDRADDIQLSSHPKHDREHEIHNKNTKAINAHYKVKVKDTGNGDALIQCDPPIKNQMPGN